MTELYQSDNQTLDLIIRMGIDALPDSPEYVAMMTAQEILNARAVYAELARLDDATEAETEKSETIAPK
jgi:hypothetical protein